jgi:hypothetical protein
MLLRPEYLSQNLDRSLPTKDGGTRRTIGQAVEYMTGIGKQRELRTRWQRACKLILAKEDVLTVSKALELALFMDAKLVCRKSRPIFLVLSQHQQRSGRRFSRLRKAAPSIRRTCRPSTELRAAP